MLCIGVTSDLEDRVAKHKNKTYAKSFTAQYKLDKPVYFEQIDGIVKAIEREKQRKTANRAKKVKLIEGMDPQWKDLGHALP